MQSILSKGRGNPSLEIQRKSSIACLPPEILLIIFKMVHSQSRSPFTTTAHIDPSWYSRQDIISPSLFPRAVESVCSSWRSVMSMVPQFWTNLVLVLDIDRPFSLPDVQYFLEFSGTLILDIVVTRQPDSRLPSAEEEKTFMKPLIKLLAPHFHRCLSFHFYTIYSDSLPLLGRDLCCAAPHLRVLKLECHIDNGGDQTSAGDWCSLFSPSLTGLVINGQNIINVASCDPAWFKTIEKLQCLIIVCLASRPERPSQRLTVYQVVRMLDTAKFTLFYLRIKDVHLEHDLMSQRAAVGSLITASVIHLENLKDTLIEALFSSATLHVNHLCITDCSLDAVRSIPTQGCLALKQIKSDLHDFEPLRTWLGGCLRITNCRNIDNHSVTSTELLVRERLWEKLFS